MEKNYYDNITPEIFDDINKDLGGCIIEIERWCSGYDVWMKHNDKEKIFGRVKIHNNKYVIDWANSETIGPLTSQDIKLLNSRKKGSPNLKL